MKTPFLKKKKEDKNGDKICSTWVEHKEIKTNRARLICFSPSLCNFAAIFESSLPTAAPMPFTLIAAVEDNLVGFSVNVENPVPLMGSAPKEKF